MWCDCLGGVPFAFASGSPSGWPRFSFRDPGIGQTRPKYETRFLFLCGHWGRVEISLYTAKWRLENSKGWQYIVGFSFCPPKNSWNVHDEKTTFRTPNILPTFEFFRRCWLNLLTTTPIKQTQVNNRKKNAKNHVLTSPPAHGQTWGLWVYCGHQLWCWRSWCPRISHDLGKADWTWGPVWSTVGGFVMGLVVLCDARETGMAGWKITTFFDRIYIFKS